MGPGRDAPLPALATVLRTWRDAAGALDSPVSIRPFGAEHLETPAHCPRLRSRSLRARRSWAAILATSDERIRIPEWMPDLLFVWTKRSRRSRVWRPSNSTVFELGW